MYRSSRYWKKIEPFLRRSCFWIFLFFFFCTVRRRKFQDLVRRATVPLSNADVYQRQPIFFFFSVYFCASRVLGCIGYFLSIIYTSIKKMFNGLFRALGLDGNTWSTIDDLVSFIDHPSTEGMCLWISQRLKPSPKFALAKRPVCLWGVLCDFDDGSYNDGEKLAEKWKKRKYREKKIKMTRNALRLTTRSLIQLAREFKYGLLCAVENK